MKIQRAASVNEVLAKLVFLILPTAVMGYSLLLNLTEYYGIIGDPSSGLLSFLPPVKNLTLQLTLAFTAGMVLSCLLYAFRFRFLPSFILLLLFFYTIYKGLTSYTSGEFDGFFIAVQFKTFSTLFITGWLAGWGLLRLRYCAVFIATVILCCCIVLVAKSRADTVLSLMQSFAPALLYSVYIIFTAEQIYSYKDKSQKFWWFLVRRLFFFGVLASLLFTGVYFMMRGEIKDTVASYGGSGKEGKNSMLSKKKDGTFDLKDYSRLQGALGRNNELLFCAHIDNFFPNTDIPNPLYLTAFYYTKFDTLTETFERDSTIPYNDLFEPDPSRLPLFFTRTDSSVIRNSLGDRLRRIVDIEVYSKNLSPQTYLAPSTGFFVQPITVEKDFRNEFKTAFRAKSYISELNSAYFVYNAQNPEIRKFQEQRFEILRKVTGYEGMDNRFMSYYTKMPQDAKFRSISDLAHKVTANAHTPVDKVLAIRDYFLSKDENGEHLFKYTDNPGVPDIPSASKLMYFLFENHKGYCAYYAGATLFMLRALGIPSRITVGFLTMDRSDKNKGWYWYYADQAHAWVQVYFPGYGWLDFDTTVGNDDARESPKPDGTPPMQPPRAWLAADGTVVQIDTLRKTMQLKVGHFIFHDKEYTLEAPQTVNLDLHIAAIRRDSMEIAMKEVTIGEKATAVSYAESFKKITAGNNEKALQLIKRFPDPEPIDELYLQSLHKEQKEEKPAVPPKKQQVSYQSIIVTISILMAGLLLLIVLLPTLIFRYYILRNNSANARSKPYWTYKAATFYLHQLGINRDERTPMQYAQQVIDPQFGSSFTQFMNSYLKYKYAQQPLTEQELVFTSGFLLDFLKQVRSKIRWISRLWAFIKPLRSVSYFVRPGDDN